MCNTKAIVKRVMLVVVLVCPTHSVLTGCVIILEMPLTLSLFIKSSIYTCRTDMRQIIKHLRQKDSGQINLLRSFMKIIFKLLES